MLWCVCHESPDFPNVFVYWQVFDSSGSFLSFVNTAADPLYGPQGLAVTSDGYVAVADSGNHCFKIYKYLQWNPTKVLGQSTLSKLHSSIVSHGESLCNTATVFLWCNHPENIICNVCMICTVSEVQLYLLLFTLGTIWRCWWDFVCLQAWMNIQMSLIFHALIVVYRVIQFTNKIQYTGTTVSTTKCNVLAYNHINVMQGR